MRIQVLSDLHIDSYAKRGLDEGQIPHTDADIILVAGDTCNSQGGMQWLQSEAKKLNKPIFTIAGNHEYFGENVFTFDKELMRYDSYENNILLPSDSYSDDKANYGAGLKFLQCQHIDVGDIRILGCTLWTDFEYQATPDTLPAVLEFMRDYRHIYADDQLFSPDISIQIHHQQRNWLRKSLLDAHKLAKKAVVMTHHSVSPKSVSKKYAQLPSNAAFVSDLSSWMSEDWAPVLWVHGHTHEAFDYRIGNTRVVVNPRAYPGELSSTRLLFDWNKIVEV